MKDIALAAAAAAAVLLSGCASVVNDTMHPMRLETQTASGQEVRDMECRLENDVFSHTIKTPARVAVRRSSTDLRISCSKEGFEEARGLAVSRANAGLAGNLLVGGALGAVVDHAKGTAYTYPEWVRLVAGRQVTFDRHDDKDGQPNMGREPVGFKPGDPFGPSVPFTPAVPLSPAAPATPGSDAQRAAGAGVAASVR